MFIALCRTSVKAAATMQTDRDKVRVNKHDFLKWWTILGNILLNTKYTLPSIYKAIAILEDPVYIKTT